MRRFEDAVESGSDNLTGASDDGPASPTNVVRRYYGAATAADPDAELDAITGDDVLEAPSVLILAPLGGTDEIHGKPAFIKAVKGGAFLLKNAQIAPKGPADPKSGVALDALTAPGAKDALVVSRILLPLPNGDLLTQVEFFEVSGGKIQHMQSYYDATRFIRALPEIGLAKLKEAFSQ